MSMSNFLQNYRCYVCGLNIFKSNKMQIHIRPYSGAAESEEIVIPKRIPRGPTDILKALATTIKRDPTAAHYKYHDDPYLIPVSNQSKRIFALSQESGRKTAMWVREQHPELFQHRVAEPPIEAFFPKVEYDETDDVDNETLAKVIKSALVNDAIRVYELMLKANVEVTEDSKQALLELLCYFNETEQLAEELIEERWFSQMSFEKVSAKKTWKDGSYAEKLFKQLPPSSKSYSAMIQGMVKYNQLEKANEYYTQALKNGFALSADAYNAILKTAYFMRHGADQRWQFIEETLRTMNDRGCKPSLKTLNVVLYLLYRMGNIRDAKRFALKMIAEVKRFDVQPSLGSFYFLLNIFCNKEASGIRCYILEDILDYLQGKEFTAQDSCDTLFFSGAMEICRFYLHDINVAYRINDLLWFGNNYNFIGNSFKESVYYRNFFTLLIQCEDLNRIMKFYDFYVPNIYTPESNVMEELIKNISLNGAVEYFPKIWTDVVMFEMAGNQKILILLLEGMTLNRPRLTAPPSDMAFKLGETAWSIYNKAEDPFKRVKMEWTGEMLGNIMTLCLGADNFSRAADIFQKLVKEEVQILGVPSFEALEMFMDACIDKQNVKLGLACIQYCSNNGYGDTMKIGKKYAKQVDLSPSNLTQLVAVLGKEVLDSEEVSENLQTATNV